MAADDPPHGRQSNTGALEFLIAMEPLEYAEQFVGIRHIKTNPIIADRDHYLIAFPGGRINRDLGLGDWRAG